MDYRRVLSGIFWRLRTAAPWADIPDHYGPYTACVNRFNRWRKAGVWDRILEAVSKAYNSKLQMIGSSSILVRQHAANGKKATRSRCMGRSRSGLTTKIHALVDACGPPILPKITEGQAHDGRIVQDMPDSLGRGDVLLGDHGYDSDALQLELATRGARANIRLMPNHMNPLPFSKRLYRKRNLVERFFNRLEHFNAILPDTTSTTTTISPPSNSLHLEFGCALMSR